MEKNALRRMRRFLVTLLAGTLAFFLMACGNQQATEETEMPGKFVTIESAVNDPDPISLTIPEGWVDNTSDQPDSVLTRLKVERSLADNGLVTGLFASRVSPKVIASVGDGGSFSVDIDAYRDRSLREALTLDDISDGVDVPNREIDGLSAPGYGYTEEIDGTTYRVQSWFVLRRDGVWEISVRGEANSDEIPAELLDAIDTIHWTPAGDGAGTSAY